VPHFRRTLGLLIALLPLLALVMVFTPAAAAPTATTVTVGNGHPGDCTMNALADVMNSNTDATIQFNCGGPATITLTQPGGLNVVFGQHFTIQGGDLITLTGLSAHRLFWVQAGSALTLTHIVLTHGFDTSSAGAIRKDSGTYLALDHVTLSDNQSLGSGGAIDDAGGTLQVTDSLFDHNRGTAGGAIFSEGALTTTNTTFSNNSASMTGGALELLGPTAISGGQVYANAAAQQGGALHINSSAAVTVDHVVFDSNYTLTPTVSLLYNGGAIHTSGPLTVTNSSFTHNSAAYGGALFEFGSLLYLSYDTFSANAAIGDGGALANDGGLVNIYTSTLKLNTAANGGAVYNKSLSSSLTLWNTGVLQNIADVLGGGIYTEDGLLVFQTQSSLIGNEAQVGGGLYVKAGGETTLLDAFVEDNMATNANGGGLYLEPGTLNGLGNVFLQGNHAAGTGGAIDNESNNFQLIDSTLTGNFAGIQGGGLYNHGSNVIIQGAVIRGNTAGTWGGGLDNQGWITQTESTIQGNTAVSAGGLYNEPGGLIDIVASTISGNVAQTGGGAVNSFDAALTLENATVSGNRAGINSGGLRADGPITLSEVTLSNNTSPSGGALTINAGAVLTDTLLAYSSGGNCIGSVSRAVFSTSSDNSCGLTNFAGGHNHDGLDPLLTGLGNYGGPTLVHMLKHNSPVLDSVIGNGPSLFDQRGRQRPGVTGSWDPGAVERQLTDSDLAPWNWLPLARR